VQENGLEKMADFLHDAEIATKLQLRGRSSPGSGSTNAILARHAIVTLAPW
jgi:hypothetical protein